MAKVETTKQPAIATANAAFRSGAAFIIFHLLESSWFRYASQRLARKDGVVACRAAWTATGRRSAEAEKLLGIEVKTAEFKVTYGAVPKGDQEIAFLTRSMLEILLDMSSYIDVPAGHVAEHRAAPGFADVGGAARGLKPLIRVYSGTERPSDAFVTIRYRDHWFWIDDRDYPSKGMFSFLMFLFTLTESGSGQISPELTVPAG